MRNNAALDPSLLWSGKEAIGEMETDALFHVLYRMQDG